ncbi:hypothetical protein N9Z59_00125 [Akkermansiaceae bacterium]|nr:hypothetical protein [Akkermansiaceae bacterium]
MNQEEPNLPKFKIYSSGLHYSLFSFGCKCAEEEIPIETAEESLKSSVANLAYKREASDREIREAIEGAYRRVLSEPADEVEKLPSYSRNKAKTIARDFSITLEEIANDSPCDPPSKPQEALRLLFNEDELICLAKDPKSPSIGTLAEHLKVYPNLCRYQLIVPNPMARKTGFTKNGKSSKRCNDNTGKRRRIVCEFDKPSPKIQPSLVAYLAEFCGMDPELILHSGGKSLHSWFRCDDWSSEEIITFEEEAAIIGADRACLGEGRKCQLVRLPAGIRDNKKDQKIHFWNPNPCFK